MNSNKILQSIESYKKYGMTRSSTSYIARNYFAIPEQYQDLFAKYYLLYWTGEHLSKQVKEGKLIHQDTEYVIIFRKPCLKVFRESQIRLSFRQPKVEFALPAYVILDTL